MPFTYDIKTDGLYLEGREEGLEKGAQRQAVETIQHVLLRLPDQTDAAIAELLGMDEDLVRRVRAGELALEEEEDVGEAS